MTTRQHGFRPVTRRGLLAAGAALPLCGILSRRGYAAQFSYKLATGQDPTHPINIRDQEAISRIQAASGGRLEIKLFPANQLGSDTDLLSQVRNGGVELFNLATSILATFVPVAGIVNTGFAFPDYSTVWKAMDGALGQHIRAQINKSGIVSVSRMMDNGFRQITTSTKVIATPADLHGLKLRVPPAPMLTSLFQAFGAGPAPINFNEVYSALQTKVVEGQENPLAIIATARLYEVQKFCSMTSHVWDGYLILGNRGAWTALPKDLQDIVMREFDHSAEDQRADIAKLSVSLQKDLTAKGLVFNEPDKAAFRAALAKTSFYGEWKKKYGAEAWGLLEASTGKLV
ncbi:MAG: TRAP transporter substrate-binding protein [Rhodospirillales bacterium]|nr:TRAP transporter substrate-binding protein [Rhodospirillales bacterium]